MGHRGADCWAGSGTSVLRKMDDPSWAVVDPQPLRGLKRLGAGNAVQCRRHRRERCWGGQGHCALQGSGQPRGFLTSQRSPLGSLQGCPPAPSSVCSNLRDLLGVGVSNVLALQLCPGNAPSAATAPWSSSKYPAFQPGPGRCRASPWASLRRQQLLPEGLKRFRAWQHTLRHLPFVELLPGEAAVAGNVSLSSSSGDTASSTHLGFVWTPWVSPEHGFRCI